MAVLVIGSKLGRVDLVRQTNISFGYPHSQVIGIVTGGGEFVSCAAGKR